MATQDNRYGSAWSEVEEMPPVKGKLSKLIRATARQVVVVRIGSSEQTLTLEEARDLVAAVQDALALVP